MAARDGLTNLEENRFWLQILGDKASIITFRLAPEQSNEIKQSQNFSSRFYQLAAQARQNLSEEQTNKLNQDALNISQEFKPFVFEILRRQLFEKFYIGILPPDINNIINMTNMYIYILNQLMQKSKPDFQPSNFLAFWLPIIVAQTIDIENNVGIYFSEFKNKAHYYSTAFLNDETRVRQGLSIMQNGMPNFPINQEVTSEVYDRLTSYAEFIIGTILLVEQKKLPTSLSSIFMDHLYRIDCYITTELSLMLGKKRPICDPGTPTLMDHYTIT